MFPSSFCHIVLFRVETTIAIRWWYNNMVVCIIHNSGVVWNSDLSSELGARQAQREVVKIKKFDFAYWAWSTPWGHVLSPITFCQNPALSWAIRYSVFQKVKFTSNFEFVCGNLFSTFWHLMVKFGYIRWF